MLLRLLHALLRLLLLLHGSLKHLLSILTTHLRLLLLLLLVLFLLILLLLVLLLLILLLLLVLLLLVLLLLVLLLLILFLLLMLAEHQVVACLVVGRIEAQCLLIGFDGLSIQAMTLTDDAHIMVRLVAAHGILLELSGFFELLYGGRIFLLCQQGIAQIVVGLRILVVPLYGFGIGYFCLFEIAEAEMLVALTDILAVGLRT